MKHTYKNITQGVCGLPSSKSLLASAVCLLMAQSAFSLEALSDSEMAKKSGKEFLTMQSIGPNDLGNPNGNVGFYRLNMDAKLELNANLDKLRLGCDTPADDSACDISIDKVSFTGIVPKVRTGYDGDPSKSGNESVYDPANFADSDGDGNYDGGIEEDTHDSIQSLNGFPLFGSVAEKLAYTKGVKSTYFNPKDVGPMTDFVMDKPFIELAIENPDSLTDRKIVGYRFGAHEVWGTMSTGKGPTIPGTTIAAPVEIFAPDAYGSSNIVSYGFGEDAMFTLWDTLTAGVPASNETERKIRFDKITEFVNDSIEMGHTGVNYISGRLPVRLDNLNVNASVFNALNLGDLKLIDKTHAQTAIVAGRLSRDDNTDFGRITGNNVQAGYLRNTYLGDRDTNYDPATYGNYAANTALEGRALTLKRGQRAVLDNMIVDVHDTTLNIGAGDKLNTQDISTRVFHQLQFGQDLDNDLRYDKGEGSKHFAFQYQSLDGLQWITTDKRFSDSYDNMGNPTGTILGPSDQQGYDWLSTRAGWWLESPLAVVQDAYVPTGQAVSFGIPDANLPIQLKSLDLGARPVDNCYGDLTFC